MGLVLPAALDRISRVQPEIVTDNGPELVSWDSVSVLQAESLRQFRARLHHPQSNGGVERDHRTFRREG